MPSFELLEYVRKTLQDGFSSEDIKNQLMKHGHSQRDIQAIFDEINTSPIHYRKPILVVLWSVLTLGLYFIYWLIVTSKELQNTVHVPLNPKYLLLLIIPGVNVIVLIIYFWNYSKAIEALTDFSAPALFLLYLLILPVAQYISQVELNLEAQSKNS